MADSLSGLFGIRAYCEVIMSPKQELFRLRKIAVELAERLEEITELHYDEEEGFYWESCGDRIGLLRSGAVVELPEDQSGDDE